MSIEFTSINNNYTFVQSIATLFYDVIPTIISGNAITGIFGSFQQIKELMSDPKSEYYIINNKEKTFKLLYQLFIYRISIGSKHDFFIPRVLYPYLFNDGNKLIMSKLQPSNPSNKFLFINGIATNDDLELMNQKRLEDLIGEPVDCLLDPTNTILIDLIDCFNGIRFVVSDSTVLLLYQLIINTITDQSINKLVLMGHSRGTLIIGQVLLKLMGLNDQYLKKLEIYAFANCSMYFKQKSNNLPYLESIGNELDTIAGFGMFNKSLTNVVDGNVLIAKGKTGHLLNSHYLDCFPNNINQYLTVDGHCSRLITYMKNCSVCYNNVL